MGSVLSLVKTLLAFAVLGAIGAYYVYTPRKTVKGPARPTAPRTASEPASTAKKGKKSRATEPQAVPDRGMATPSQHAVVFPGSFVDAQQLDDREVDGAHEPNFTAPQDTAADTEQDKAAAAAAKKKRKPKKSAASSTTAPVASGSQATTPVPEVPPPGTLLGPNDGPWTRVETRAKVKKAAASPSVSSSGLTTEEDGESSTPLPEPQQQTLAERLVPRAPATKVDECVAAPRHATPG